eukprot:scaffold94451_cov19-Tisochrysis_lutea.AAC.1
MSWGLTLLRPAQRRGDDTHVQRGLTLLRPMQQRGVDTGVQRVFKQNICRRIGEVPGADPAEACTRQGTTGFNTQKQREAADSRNMDKQGSSDK